LNFEIDDKPENREREKIGAKFAVFLKPINVIGCHIISLKFDRY
jgi:hypothetical protein